MRVALQYLILAFSALLPLINPVGSAIVVLGIVGPLPDRTMRSMARRVALSTAAFLIVIDIAGAAILKLFGVSLPVVQLAGGLVVAAMGWRLLNQPDPETTTVEPPPDIDHINAHITRKIFYPLTFPITAGPGTLVVALTLSAQASKGGFQDILFAQLGTLAGMMLLCIAVYLFYAYSARITARVSPTVVHGIMRVIAFVVICIGVQIAWNGFMSLSAGHEFLIR